VPKIARRSGDGNNDPDGRQDQRVVGIDGLIGRRHASIPTSALRGRFGGCDGDFESGGTSGVPPDGFTLAVVEPGKPSGMYHAESTQENFLVLSGTCLLMIEEQERALRAWDFLRCPANGHRREGGTIVYPRSDAALLRKAGVDAETRDPSKAYTSFPSSRLGRPEAWAELPWFNQG